MTQQHPVTPPSELLQLWGEQLYGCNKGFHELLIEAARWGADTELEACCEWLGKRRGWEDVSVPLRAERRPKPPSSKEQALQALDSCSCDDADSWKLIRHALEQLPDPS